MAVLRGEARVMDEHGNDRTAAFLRGAEETLRIVRIGFPCSDHFQRRKPLMRAPQGGHSRRAQAGLRSRNCFLAWRFDSGNLRGGLDSSARSMTSQRRSRSGDAPCLSEDASIAAIVRARLLNPENQTTKSPRHEEVEGRFSFFFVSSWFIPYRSLRTLTLTESWRVIRLGSLTLPCSLAADQFRCELILFPVNLEHHDC